MTPPLAFPEPCYAAHPTHGAMCYRSAGHNGSHRATGAQGHLAWGITAFTVVAEVEHGGSRYLMLDDGYFECCFVGDRATPGKAGCVDWRFQCWGLHVGPVLDIWITNVRGEWQGDEETGYAYYAATWGETVWVDDNTPLTDAAFLDGYLDELSPEIQQILTEAAHDH